MKQMYSSMLVIAALFFIYGEVNAGGPLNSFDGRPVIFQNSTMPIPYTVDQGDLGTLSNAQATALVDMCFNPWQEVPTASISLHNTGQLPEDINSSNYINYFDSADGLNPILFDSDGGIVDDFFGAGASNSIIGFSGSEYDNATGYYTEGIALLNGKFSSVFTYEQFKATFVHEFGHLIGLDHCQINAGYAGDGNTANDIYIPTMFPTATDDDISLGNLNPDDKAALTLLYPASDTAVNAAYGKLRGTVTWMFGKPVLGANVVAVKTGDEDLSQFSSVSDYYQLNSGAYEMLVTPGTYTLFIEPVKSSFNNGSSVGPYANTSLSPSFLQPVRTAYYSGEVTVGAGETVSNINFIARHARFSQCPVEAVLGENSAAVHAVRRFRDEVLNTTQEGQNYTKLYYVYADEINSMLAGNPDIKRECAKILLKILPDLKSALNGTGPALNAGTLTDINSLCTRMSGHATPGLRKTLLRIKNHIMTQYAPGMPLRVDAQGMSPITDSLTNN